MAQPAGLVAGGLTQLATPVYTQLLVNGGFEDVAGDVPVGWTPHGTWALDSAVKRTGNYSYRLGSAGAQAAQTMAIQSGVYRLSGWIKTQSSGSGSVRLTLDSRPGGINEWAPTSDLSGTNDWTYREVIVTIPTDRTVGVYLEGYYATAGFTAWFDDVSLEMQQPLPVSVFMLYPNYRGMLFDDQSPTMRFDVTVTPPVGDIASYSVTATLAAEASGTVVASQTYPAAANFEADLDGSAMAPGQGYLVTFSLVDGSGSPVYSHPAYRVSRLSGAARMAMNISFDEKNHVLINGTPRFVLGVYDSGMGYGNYDAWWENALWSPTGDRRMTGLPISMYLNYYYGAADLVSMGSLQENLARHGVMYLQTGNCFDHWPPDPTFQINASDSYVQAIASQPGGGGFYTIDECQTGLIPGAFGQYDRLRQLAPGNVTFSALLPNTDVPLWRDSVDIVSTDPYPMYGAEPPGGYPMYKVADGAAMARTAVKDARPWMTVLQFFQFTSQGRWPTRQEMRNHAYMAIVEGAHGLWWWSLGANALQSVCSNWCAARTQHMNDLKAVVSEIADLEHVLLADDTAGALTGNSNPTEIRTKVKVVDGKGYVFAYNYTNTTVTPTFGWNCDPGTVTANGEGRTVPTSGSSFIDTFGPYQAHVYVLDNGGTGGGPILSVAFSTPPANSTVNGVPGGNTYSVSVDGVTKFTYSTRSAGPVSMPWTTTAADNER